MQLIENYQILEQIGQGAYGQVFKAKHQETQEIVALKLQQFCSEIEYEFTKQLCQAKFQNVLNHIKIFTKDEGFLSYTVIVTEFCNYKDLYQFIQSQQIDDQLLQNICYQVCFGLWELSQVQILHRDIKPQNILVHRNEDGSFLFKICDLGISKLQQDAKTVNIGTPYYMAPELIGHGSTDKYDNKVDIWAFGAMIAEFQTKQPLFNGKSLPEVFRQIREKIISPFELEKRITHSVIRDQVFKMLSKNAYERPSAEQILNAIDLGRFDSDKNQSKIKIDNSKNKQYYQNEDEQNNLQYVGIQQQIQQVQSIIQYDNQFQTQNLNKIDNSKNKQHDQMENQFNDLQQVDVQPQIQQFQSIIQYDNKFQTQNLNIQPFKYPTFQNQQSIYQKIDCSNINNQQNQDQPQISSVYPMQQNNKLPVQSQFNLQQQAKPIQNQYQTNYFQKESNLNLQNTDFTFGQQQQQIQNQQINTDLNEASNTSKIQNQFLNQDANQYQQNSNNMVQSSQKEKSKNFITNQVSLRAHLRDQKLITEILNEVESNKLTKYLLLKKLDDHLQGILDNITVESIKNQY